MNSQNRFDIIVVGSGHAGSEASLAAARMGVTTLLITHNLETIGQMSCNPSIGGIGKGHIVKEIDALCGMMARASDHAGIQFRILNRSKGPAVRATRAQMDRILYKNFVRNTLENQTNLSIFQDSVDDLIIKNNKIQGVITKCGLKIFSKTVVLTTGTFLNGKIHIGLVNFQSGRSGEPASIALAKRLRELPFRVSRLKTGTPPRINGQTIDYSKVTEQPGDIPTPVFSFFGKVEEHPKQISCFITHTNEKTHEIIYKNLNRSPLFRGDITGIGPRYCPSIEDKIVRFKDKTSHQIFIEPEGLYASEMYPNGLPTSLPFDVQCDFIRSIKGFENAHITKPGYAIEYDFFDPRDLKPSLETKIISGLFFAGQINGTTGYEEAAGQGLIAGLNAALQVKCKDSWYPRRDEAYIGVMIDDLITKGTTEPYRMFTSRAEYRLILREDNADLRLTEKGRILGLVDDKHFHAFETKRNLIEKEKIRLKKVFIKPETTLGEKIEKILNQKLSREYNLADLIKRPDVSYQQLMSEEDLNIGIIDKSVIDQIEIQIKYEGYIDRQHKEIEKQNRYENTRIPSNFDYTNLNGLSTEVRQKLETFKPETIGIASRIPGITPAAISLLLIYLKKLRSN